jgi:chemotaxis protein MotB
MIDTGGGSGGQTANPFEAPEIPGGRVNDMPAGKTNTAADPDPELQEMKELLEESVSLEMGSTESDNKLQMQFDSRGLIVRLAVKDFFDEGEVEVQPDLRPVLERIGRIVMKTRHLVRIEGHTDKAEASIAPKSGYASDWELSAARASWVVKYWVKRFDLDPSKIGIAGYSHHRPLASGDDQWSRSKNRRIEVIILNNTYETP